MCGVRLAVVCILAAYAVSAFPDSSNPGISESSPPQADPSALPEPVPVEPYNPHSGNQYPPSKPYSAKTSPPKDSWGFECPCVGNFADPYSKNFISCIQTISGGFEAIPRDCPGDLCYNAPIDACDWPRNVDTKQCRDSQQN